MKVIFPILTGLVTFLGLEFIYLRPDHLVKTLVALIIFWLISWYLMIGKKFASRLMFLATPLSLSASGIFWAVFLENDNLRHALAVFLGLAVWYYLRVLKSFFYEPAKYQINSIGYLSEYLNLLTVFFVSSGFFSLRIFLQYSVVTLSLLNFITFTLLFYQAFWANKIDRSNCIKYSLAVALLVTEAFIAVSFLPTGFYSNGLAITAVYYGLVNLSLAYLQEKFRYGLVLNFVLVSILSLIIVYSTATWS